MGNEAGSCVSVACALGPVGRGALSLGGLHSGHSDHQTARLCQEGVTQPSRMDVLSALAPFQANLTLTADAAPFSLSRSCISRALHGIGYYLSLPATMYSPRG